MTQPLFDPNKCDIPSISSLAFDFVEDCSIPASPPPIFDCPMPIVPPDPPPIPCPQFETKAQAKLSYFGCGVDSSNSAALIFTQTDVDPCRFFVDLDLNLKIPPPVVPCPAISIGSATMTVEYEDCLPPERQGLNIAITKNVIPANCQSNTADSCQFKIDLDLGIPIPRPQCPEISVGSFAVNTDWAGNIKQSSTLVITRDEPPLVCLDGSEVQQPCKFTVDLDLQIPIPPTPCPEISVGEFSVNVDWVEKIAQSSQLLITRSPPPLVETTSSAAPCKFTLDLNLQIPIPRPPCPEITAAIDVTGVAVTANPTGTLTIVPNNTTESCAFDIELDLKIPQPCVPRFWCGTAYSAANCSFIEILPPGQEPYVNLTFEKSPGPFDPPNDCDYKIGLDIGIPTPPCPEITATVAVTGVAPTDNPTGTLTIVPTSATGPCEYNIELDLKIPQPCVPRFWCSARFPPNNCSAIEILAPEQEPYVHLTFEKSPGPFDPPNDCDYEIGLDIGIPALAGPTGATGTAGDTGPTGPAGGALLETASTVVVTNVQCVNGQIQVSYQTITVIV